MSLPAHDLCVAHEFVGADVVAGAVGGVGAVSFIPSDATVASSGGS